MLKRVSIIVKDNPYNSLRIFSLGLQKAFEKKGIQTQWVDAGKSSHLATDELQAMYAFSPDLTLSFSEMDPLPDGRYLWDVVQIPHLAMLVDPAIYFINQIDSSYLFHSCIDREDVIFLNHLGFDRAFFLPHAIDGEWIKQEKVEKNIDLLFMGTCYDYRWIRDQWNKTLPDSFIKILEQAIDLFFSTPFLRFNHAIDQSIRHLSFDLPLGDRFTLMKELDFYVRSYDRISLLQAVSLHFPLTVVGGGLGHAHIGGSWQDHFSSSHQVTLYPEVSYEESIKWMQRSKILLNSSPCYYQGVHERILMGLVSGCAVLTNRSKYCEECFGDDCGVEQYIPGKWSEVSSKIDAFLKGDEYVPSSHKGAELVKNQHTWTERVNALLEVFPNLYSRIFTVIPK